MLEIQVIQKQTQKEKVNIKFTDKYIKLRDNEANIIGRGLVIHADLDDCGKGDYSDSKTTGHAGKRIGCAIIGYAIIGYASTCYNNIK